MTCARIILRDSSDTLSRTTLRTTESDRAAAEATGASDSGNEAVTGAAGGKSEARRIPKAAGSAGLEIPEEFRKALDAYNRGTEEKLK